MDLETIAQLRRDIRERRVVRLNYQSGSAAEPRWREVHPLGLIFHSGMWYLVADGGEEYRFFRADRIHGLERQESRFELRREFATESVGSGEVPFSFPVRERLAVRFERGIARWIAEREGRALLADGSLTAEYPLGDAEWALRFVLQYGTAARAVAPPRIGAEIRRRLLAISDPPPSTRER